MSLQIAIILCVIGWVGWLLTKAKKIGGTFGYVGTYVVKNSLDVGIAVLAATTVMIFWGTTGISINIPGIFVKTLEAGVWTGDALFVGYLASSGAEHFMGIFSKGGK